MILVCPSCGTWMWNVEDLPKQEFYLVNCMGRHIVMIIDSDFKYLRMAGKKKWESEEDDRIFGVH